MATDEQLDNFLGSTAIADPKDVDLSINEIWSPAPSQLDSLRGVWTQPRIDKAQKSLNTSLGLDKTITPNALQRSVGLQTWWKDEGQFMPNDILKQLGVRGKTFRSAEVEQQRAVSSNIKSFLGIKSGGDPLKSITTPITGQKIDATTGATVKVTDEEKQAEEMQEKLIGLDLDDLNFINQSMINSPLDYSPEAVQAVEKEIGIKKHLPRVFEAIREDPAMILWGTPFLDAVLQNAPSRTNILDKIFKTDQGEVGNAIQAVSRVREMILASDPRLGTRMAFGTAEVAAEIIKFVALPDPSKIKVFAQLSNAAKTAIGVGTKAGLIELLKPRAEGEAIDDRAATVAKATGIGALTGAALSKFFTGAKAVFQQIKDLPISKQATRIMQQPRPATVGASGEIPELTHAETVRLLKHLKSTDPEQFAKAIGYKAVPKKVVAREIPAGFRAGAAEIEKPAEAAGELAKAFATGAEKGKQAIAKAGIEAAKAVASKAPPVKKKPPTKIISEAQAGPFRAEFPAKEGVPATKIIADPKVRQAVQSGENKVATLQNKLAQAKADHKTALARQKGVGKAEKELAVVTQLEKDIASKQEALEKIAVRSEVKLTKTIDEANVKIVKIMATHEFKEELRTDALSMVQAIPKEQRPSFVRRAFNVKTPAGVQKLAVEIQEGMDKFAKRAAISDLKKTFSGIEKKNRRGNVRLGEVPSPQREKLIELIDSVDLAKLSTAKEAELASLDNHVKKMAIDLSGEVSALDKSEPDDPTGFVPKKVIQELGRMSQTNINDMTTEDIKWINIAAQSIAHEAKTKSHLMVGRGLKPITVDNAVEKATATVVPTRRVTKEQKAVKAGGEEDVEKGHKVLDAPRNAALADMHLDRLIEVATGPQRDVMVRLLDTDPHRGQRQSAETLLSLVDRAAPIMKDLGLKDLDQIKKEKVSVTLAGKKVKISLSKLIKLELHFRSPDNLKAVMTTDGWAIGEKLIKYPKGMNPAQRVRELNDALDVVRNNPMLSGLADLSNTLQPELADTINETTQQLWGFDIAIDPQYTSRPRWRPKRVGGAKVRKDVSTSPEQQGFMLPRTGGNDYMRLEDWDVDFLRQIEGTAYLHGMAIPLRNARILVENPEFQATMIGAGRRKDLDNIITILQRTQGTPTSGSYLDVFGRVAQKGVGVAGLGLRMSSGGTAAMSYPAIGAEASGRAMARPMTPVSPGYLAKMRDDSAVLALRQRGHRVNAEVGISGAADAFSLMFFGKSSSIANKSFVFVQAGDNQAIGNAHKVSVREMLTTKRNGKNVDPYTWEGKNVADLPFMDTEFEGGYPVHKDVRYAAARRAEYLVRRSQPMYDSLDRSVLGGDPNIALRTFLPFRTALNAQYNVAVTAINDYAKSGKTKADKARLGKAMGALTASAAAVAFWKKGFRWAKNSGITKIKEAFGIFSFDEEEELKTLDERGKEVLIDTAKNIGKLSTVGKFLIGAGEIAADRIYGDGYNWNRKILDNPALELSEDLGQAAVMIPQAIAEIGKLDELIVGTDDDPLTDKEIKFNEQLRDRIVDATTKAIRASVSAGARIAMIPVIAPYQEWIKPALKETKIKIIRETTFADMDDPRDFATKVATIYAIRSDLKKLAKDKKLSRNQEDALVAVDSFVSIADKTAERIKEIGDLDTRREEFELIQLRLELTRERLQELTEEE